MWETRDLNNNILFHSTYIYIFTISSHTYNANKVEENCMYIKTKMSSIANNNNMDVEEEVEVEKVVKVVEEEDEDEEDGNDITLERYMAKWEKVKSFKLRMVQDYIKTNIHRKTEICVSLHMLIHSGLRPGAGLKKDKSGSKNYCIFSLY